MESQRDPHYTPFGKLKAARPRDSGEVLWTFRREGVDWSCEMVLRGERYGWEARVRSGGELSLSRRFVLREPAVRWADDQHSNIERGWIDR